MVQNDSNISVAIARDCSNWNQCYTTQEDIPAEIQDEVIL